MRRTIKTEHAQHGVHYWHYDPDEEGQKGLPKGFIMVWPTGGGFAKRVPVAHVTEWDAEIPTVFERAFVGFPELEGYAPIPCYLNPHENWNGWMAPRVDEKGMDLFLKQQAELAKECNGVATGKRDRDEVVWHDPNYEEGQEDLRIIPEWITVKGEAKEVKVWDISLGFTWDRYSQEELAAIGHGREGVKND